MRVVRAVAGGGCPDTTPPLDGPLRPPLVRVSPCAGPLGCPAPAQPAQNRGFAPRSRRRLPPVRASSAPSPAPPVPRSLGLHAPPLPCATLPAATQGLAIVVYAPKPPLRPPFECARPCVRNSCPCGRHSQRDQKRLKDSLRAAGSRSCNPLAAEVIPIAERIKTPASSTWPIWRPPDKPNRPVMADFARRRTHRLRKIVHSGPTRPLHEPRWCLGQEPVAHHLRKPLQ